MIFLRIKRRFRGRASEWFCAANMTQWGVTLLHPSPTFKAPAYEKFAQLTDETTTGLVIGGLGLAWLIALIINGARQRMTSSLRMLCAFLGAVIYIILALVFFSSYLINGLLPTLVGTNILIALLALYALYWIAVDKRTNG
jgi:hypothetical protein